MAGKRKKSTGCRATKRRTISGLRKRIRHLRSLLKRARKAKCPTEEVTSGA